MVKLILIGTGPGEPDLLTLRAIRCLRKARLVFAPLARSGESRAYRTVKEFLPKDTQVVFLPFHDQEDFAALAREVVGAISSGHHKQAVFLVLGDPLLYSSFFRLFSALRTLLPDLTLEVIPGISAFQLAAAYATLPLTQKEEVLTLAPATLPEDRLGALAELSDTLILYKLTALKDRESLRRLSAKFPLCLLGEDLGGGNRLTFSPSAFEGISYLSLLVLKKHPLHGTIPEEGVETMENFEFHNPTRVLFGKGTTDRVGEICAGFGKRVLFVYGGGSIKKTGLYDRLQQSLTQHNLEVFELPGIKPNPTLSKVREGVRLCKEKNIEVVLAVGGGSVLDSAKIIAAGARYEGDPWDFFIDKSKVPGRIPLVTVLTLAATGSEMNHNAVITNEATKEKLGLGHPALFPDVSILDPENTFTVPKDHTVYGIVDMMAHVFEQYFHKTPETPLQDRLAESIMKTIIEYTPRVLENPKDYDARATIMWCGTLALNHLIEAGVEGDWSSHDIEHELSAFYDIPHGAGLAIVFPQWMTYVLDEIPGKFAQFAERVWGIPRANRSDEDLGRAGIERTREWFREIGAPTTLREVGIGEELFETMAEKATKRGPLGSVKKLKKEDVLAILRMCL